MLKRKPIRIVRMIARLNIGGPAIQAISLTEELSRDQYETLLVCGNVSPHEGDMTYLATQKGLEPIILSKLGREISLFDDLNALMNLRKIIKQFRPHIIHTHTAKAGTLGRLAGISLNMAKSADTRIRLVHTFHGHIFHSYFGPRKTRFFIQTERFLSRITDRIIVISPLQKDDICQKFRIAPPEKVSVIPLGFDLSVFKNRKNNRKRMREKYLGKNSQKTLLVGIIGRLTAVKDNRILLSALKCLKDMGRIQAFKFLFVGDGELRHDLINFARELGVESSVIFTGWQKDMPSIYGALDIVALTSLNEGTPVSLIEGMAAAKVVVATDVGGVRDLMGVVEDGSANGYKLAQNGILVPSGNEEVLARALLFLLENRETCKKMASHARQSVLNKYSMERLVKDINSLYGELLKNRAV